MVDFTQLSRSLEFENKLKKYIDFLINDKTIKSKHVISILEVDIDKIINSIINNLIFQVPLNSNVIIVWYNIKYNKSVYICNTY